MQHRRALRSNVAGAIILALATSTWAEEPKAPWQVNSPIVTLRKELYKKHQQPRAAALASVVAVGPDLQLRETQSVERQSDVGDDIRARWSTDNGRTWSEFVLVQASNIVKYQGVPVWEGGAAEVYDPASGLLVQYWLRQIQHGGLYHCFTYVRTSADFGRSFSPPTPLAYEPAPPFDPAHPLDPKYLDHNEGYPGSNILVRRDGTLVACLAHANANGDPKNNQRPWRMGSVLFLGKWNADRHEYQWKPGARVEISPAHSARGLMEPEVAELADGRLLVVWRGSTHGYDKTVAKIPGRKFFSLSRGGGQSLTPPAEWKYADGSSFYSPSSYHRMIRHSTTGRLYWIGNITMTPPSGNSPRFPLVIAEVDEANAALIRSTVTAIDDRSPSQGRDVQFSNFSLYEDRQTHELVLYLTTYGQEPNPADWATADCYRYRLQLVKSASPTSR